MAKPNPKFQYREYTNIIYNTDQQFADDPRADVYKDTKFKVSLFLENLGAKGKCLFQVWEGGKGRVLQSKEKELDTNDTITIGDLSPFTLPGDYAVGDDLDITLYAYYWDPDKWDWEQTDSLG